MSRKVKVFRSGYCRVTLQLEAALSGGKIDRRVLATDVDAELGLMTCVWSRIGQTAQTVPPGLAHGFSLIPVSGVGVVVDEVKTEGNAENSGTPQK